MVVVVHVDREEMLEIPRCEFTTSVVCCQPGMSILLTQFTQLWGSEGCLSTPDSCVHNLQCMNIIELRGRRGWDMESELSEGPW